MPRGRKPKSQTTDSADTRQTENQRGIAEEGTAGGNETEGVDIKETNESSMVESPNIVEIPLPDSPSPTPSKRGRKKGSTNSNNKKSGIGVNEVSALICGAFGLASMKLGEHWKVTESEAEKIATPLCNILEKMNILEKVAKVSDGAMLLTAVGMVVVPRAIITVEINKQKKGKKVDGDRTERIQESTSHKSNSESDNGRGGQGISSDSINGKANVFFPANEY